MVQRAAAQTGPEGAEAAPKRSDATRYTGISRSLSGTLALDKDVFWFAAQGKDRFRWNMLNSLPLLRQVGTGAGTLRAGHEMVVQLVAHSRYRLCACACMAWQQLCQCAAHMIGCFRHCCVLPGTC